MRPLTLLFVFLLAACAGELADPERFESGGSVDAGPGGGGADAGGQSGADASPSGGGADATPGDTCSDPLNDIIIPRCSSGACHDADAPAAGLDLLSAGHAARLVDVASGCNALPLVDSGNIAASYLLEKLGAAPTCGGQMPPGVPMNADDIACVTTWVEGL